MSGNKNSGRKKLTDAEKRNRTIVLYVTEYEKEIILGYIGSSKDIVEHMLGLTQE